MIINLLSSFTVIFFIAIKFPTISFATTNETDLQALLHIKNHIHNDPFQNLKSWNNSIHFCNWPGITCGKRHKRVTVLDVSSLSLVGTLSPYVGNLTFLREINLSNNSFRGVIPSEIGRLFRLRYLVFTNNLFYKQVPTNLTLCMNLRVIDLSGNTINGRIPDQMSALSKLQELELSKNDFNGHIPPSLGNISTLEVLCLSNNHLIRSVPHELGKLFNLRVLHLGVNNLSGYLSIEIYNISSIKSFEIAFNNLTGQFPDTLGVTLPKLMQFLVANNTFLGSIPSTLTNASYLEQFDISNNMLTGPIPRNLGSVQYLRRFLFDANPLGIDKDNDISFITTLTNCTILEELSFSEIEIRGVLPMEISNLSRKLTKLVLSGNHISGNLPKGIGDLIGLNRFDASSNTLSGNIPISLGKLRNLNGLYLQDNNFIGEIPSSIGDISGLMTLYLQQNMLTGSIPVSLSNLSEPRAFHLSQNHLNGSIPKELFSINSPLHALLLDRNKFTGSLPSEVCNLKNLINLNVSDNELSGEIPISIDGCQMLVRLGMEGNSLYGMIPSTLGQLKSIELMDLSHNKLSGKIPTSMEELKFIRFLNLSFNMLEGEVPIDGVFVDEHVFSIVGNEKLCGGIKSLNLSICTKINSKKHTKLSTNILITLVICIPLALVFLFGCAYATYHRRSSKVMPFLASLYDNHLLRISYAEILTSTNGFSSENLIGEGKYGLVYRGVLKPSEKVIAVKVFKLQVKGAHKSFLTECEALRNIRHKNLVKIITSCSSIDSKGNDFKALIFEYASNGSLEEWLHQNPSVHVNEKKLNFFERLNIAIDIATALDYLHNHSGKLIVHCDIKPNNILLDKDLRGMVSDFGIAKFLPTDNDTPHDIESTSTEIRGTIGYVAPEYGMGEDVSAKGDIYSYGILLLEMFTGKKPTDNMFIGGFSLHNYVKTALHHRVAEIIDPQLLTIVDNEECGRNYTSTRIETCCLSIFRIGVSCSSVMQKERMDVNAVLIELQHVRNEL